MIYLRTKMAVLIWPYLLTRALFVVKPDHPWNNPWFNLEEFARGAKPPALIFGVKLWQSLICLGAALYLLEVL